MTIPVAFSFMSFGSAMVRKAETVPCVRTGNMMIPEEMNMLVVSDSLWRVMISDMMCYVLLCPCTAAAETDTCMH